MSDLVQQMEAMPEGHWISVSELAKLKGISRQTASEKVAKLESEGRLSTRKNGRLRMVELATYDRLVGQIGDAAREIGAATKKSVDEASGNGGALRDAQAEKAKYETRLKALDFAERTGQVVPIKGEHGIEAALIKVCDHVVRDLGMPMQWIDEIMEASRKGEPHLRRLMRTKIAEQRKVVAEHLLELSGEASRAEAQGIDINVHFDGDD
ncbi:winged helix-turn-helix domain-containing protein [Ensifer adhaerens]|uniref:winged helix-turn-helix domain-containing protein n=1 Tax=Ensifer adhaerens TaxID=106592 RepID=UPI001CBD274E|nr:winged helix-turn-helix domain-containing protein [Ensifer adhaerens]MBZ7923119.1 winged helix-turn-helix domain-containing protein [Ensifer adhaerens]UAX91709.1 winged helix-turn-helix domain-containing protein [Ensifer adhaerens]UAX99337.1 winged helix-turn-helix domain-containing protein [Ensifer adhaerens]UAY06720.1 winged helix-turn-helix domain-containing protein [Ensifer adhaerens]